MRDDSKKRGIVSQEIQITLFNKRKPWKNSSSENIAQEESDSYGDVLSYENINDEIQDYDKEPMHPGLYNSLSEE